MSPKGSVVVVCVCWACLKIEYLAGRFVFDFDLKRPTAALVATHRPTGIVGYRKLTPLCTRICPYPLFEATPPGAAPGPPVPG